MLHGRRREGPMGEVSLDTLHSSLWHRLLVLPLGWALPCHPLYSLALKPFTPAVPFTCPFFFPPRNPGRVVGMSPVKGAQGEEGTGSQESFILVVIILTGRKPDH